jgi:hypothetical protein
LSLLAKKKLKLSLDNIEFTFSAFRTEVISTAPTAGELFTYRDRKPESEVTTEGSPNIINKAYFHKLSLVTYSGFRRSLYPLG